MGTGSYDAESDTLFWTTGNPFPETDGDDRKGTNLYTNCVVALEAKTGKLRWYYQFTPHDLHDWDATEPLLLVDTKFRGRDRKLMLQANRNGLFLCSRSNHRRGAAWQAFRRKLNWGERHRSRWPPADTSSELPDESRRKGMPGGAGRYVNRH